MIGNSQGINLIFRPSNKTSNTDLIKRNFYNIDTEGKYSITNWRIGINSNILKESFRMII